MGGTEGLALDFPRGEIFLASKVQGIAVGLFEIDGEGEFTDVMEEGGGVGGVRQFGIVGDVFGDGASGVGDGLAMFPNVIGGEIEELDVIEA